MTGSVDIRLREAGIEIPEAAVPVANYLPWVRTGALVHVSGQLPLAEGRLVWAGRLGDDFWLDDGYEAAKLCAVNLIAQVKTACNGDLTRVTRVVKLTGWINSTPGFTEQPQVLNGASDLMALAFGEIGRHARAAVAAPALPMGAAVEVDGLFEVRD